MATKKLSAIVIDALEDIKARDIKLINVSKLTSVFDYIVVASADSTRQTKALAHNVIDKVKESGGWVYGIEGQDAGEWVLVDCGDIVVHVMQPAVREHYKLEEFWSDGKVEYPKPVVEKKRAPVKEVAAAPAKKKAAAKPKAKTAATTKRKTATAKTPTAKTTTKKSTTAKAKSSVVTEAKKVVKKKTATTTTKKPATPKVAKKPPATTSTRKKATTAAKTAAKKPAPRARKAKAD
ncbi:MAG: ribosome silencing factor [Betaproteobacteria bacterium]|nr:ribosome silencing factor [Betaproteobacteria bacterium]